MQRGLAAGLFAILTGCAISAGRTTETQVAVERTVDARAFVPLAPVPPGEGVCRTRDMQGGERLVLLASGTESAGRRVGFAVDAAGTVVSYSDIRGELREGRAGATTLIALDFVRDAGSARNERGGRVETLATGRASEMRTLENLGNPARMIETVRARCGTGR